jgi:meiotic recombination protein SPO11
VTALLTGEQAKGYPDVLTRSFLRTIHEADRILPFYALVDWDPDGVAIFLTYKHGSAALAHENHALRVPSMECLGVKSEDLLGGEWKVDEHSGEVGRELGGVIRPKDTESGGRSSIELVTLTTRDRSKAVSTLKRAAEGGDVGEASWVRELQVMLMLGFKAELQALDTGNDRLQTWLEQKLGPRET